MARFAQALLTGRESHSGRSIVLAMHNAASAAKVSSSIVKHPSPCEWLVLWGVGAADRDAARHAQVSAGGRAMIWDMGYLCRAKRGGYLRMSLDEDHPWRMFDKTPDDPSRFDRLGVKLSEEGDPGGHIVIVGLGSKTRDQYPELRNWEAEQLEQLRERFPGRRVVLRPKPRHHFRPLDCEVRQDADIRDVLRGASLVVTRHSSVAVDAVVMGVPFECVDGAAFWLMNKPFTREWRHRFLVKLAWWQWLPEEAVLAWGHALRMHHAHS